MFQFLDYPVLHDDVLELRLARRLPAEPDKGYVPAYYYFMFERHGSEPVGYIDLRIGSNENTHYGGNIGYRVEEEYRGHGYAGRACQLLIPLALAHDMRTLRITCNPDNIASRRTIEKLGAELLEIATLPPYNELYQRGEPVKCLFDWHIGEEEE